MSSMRLTPIFVVDNSVTEADVIDLASENRLNLFDSFPNRGETFSILKNESFLVSGTHYTEDTCRESIIHLARGLIKNTRLFNDVHEYIFDGKEATNRLSYFLLEMRNLDSVSRLDIKNFNLGLSILFPLNRAGSEQFVSVYRSKSTGDLVIILNVRINAMSRIYTLSTVALLLRNTEYRNLVVAAGKKAKALSRITKDSPYSEIASRNDAYFDFSEELTQAFLGNMERILRKDLSKGLLSFYEVMGILGMMHKFSYLPKSSNGPARATNSLHISHIISIMDHIKNPLRKLLLSRMETLRGPITRTYVIALEVLKSKEGE